MSYDIKPSQRIVTVTLQEFTINAHGEKVELIQPYQVKAVVMENDFSAWVT